MYMWLELSNLIDGVSLSEEEDQIMRSFTSNGIYAVQSSLYVVINHSGATPVFVSAIWKLNVPPRIQFSLWLLPNNQV